MSDRVSKAIAWLTAILGAITTIIKFFSVKGAVVSLAAAQADGVVASPNVLQDLINDILAGGAGLGAMAISVFIPWIVRFVSSKVGSKIPKGYVAAIDRTACETLLQTRDDLADIAHVTALIESGVKLEVAQRLEAVKSAKVA
jgi:hypothetical protein